MSTINHVSCILLSQVNLTEVCDLIDTFCNGTQDPFLSLTLSTQGVNHYSISYVTLSNTIVYIQHLVLLSRLAVYEHNSVTQL